MSKPGSSLIIVCTTFAFISLMMICALKTSGFLFDLSVMSVEKAKKEMLLEGLLSYAIGQCVQGQVVNNFIWTNAANKRIQVNVECALEKEVNGVGLQAKLDGVLYGNARAEFILDKGKYIILAWNIWPT